MENNIKILPQVFLCYTSELALIENLWFLRTLMIGNNSSSFIFPGYYSDFRTLFDKEKLLILGNYQYLRFSNSGHNWMEEHCSKNFWFLRTLMIIYIPPAYFFLANVLTSEHYLKITKLEEPIFFININGWKF